MLPALDVDDELRNPFEGKDCAWLLRMRADQTPEETFFIWSPPGPGGSTADAGGGVGEGAAVGDPGESEETWTYARFLEDATAAALDLADRGVARGDAVMIHAENSPQFLMAWWGCMLLGATVVTTNTRLAGAEIGEQAARAEVVGVLTDRQHQQLCTEFVTAGWQLVMEDWDPGEAAGRTLPERPAEPMLPAMIQFTSGTTSRPKAVVLTHANLLWGGRSAAQNLAMRPDDRYLVFLPLFHINAVSWCTMATMWTGSSMVLLPKFSASRFWELSMRHRCTLAQMIPFCVKAIGDQPIPEHHYRVWTTGARLHRIEERFKVTTFTCWGMTETVSHATRSDIFADSPELSIGMVSPGYQLAVIDPQTGREAEPGVNGNLHVRGQRGVTIMLGYADEEHNEASFTADGWLRTGDRARYGEDGWMWFGDRSVDVIKCGAENVSARQIEELLTAKIPEVLWQVAVVAQPHPMLGEVPVLFTVLRPNVEPDHEAISQRVQEILDANLAEFKHPRRIYLRDELPSLTLGKIAKSMLREEAARLADW